MKTTKEKADELVKQFYYHEFDKVETHEATIHAINAVKHTLEILNNVITHDKERYGITCRGATIELEEQTELLAELESRL